HGARGDGRRRRRTRGAGPRGPPRDRREGVVMSRIPVAVLGATGLVGQRLLQLLEAHPWFEAVHLCGSPRSVGLAYADAVTWRLAGEVPAGAARLRLRPGDARLE